MRSLTTLELRASMVDRPGAVLRFLFSGLFSAIHFGEAETVRIRDVATRGPVVYVLRTVSYLELLYFNYALAKHGLPLARFVNGGVRTILLWPLRVAMAILFAIWRFAAGQRLESEEDTMTRRLKAGDAVLLFLRPSHHLVGDAAARVRGRFIESLLALQKELARPLQLVPMTLLWGHPAVRPGRKPLDVLFGQPESPGRLRAFFQFVRHHKSSVVKVGEVLDLRSFLDANDGRSGDAVARTLRFELSGRIERERRAVLGPHVKDDRRIRQEVMRSRKLSEVIDQLTRVKGTSRAVLVERADKILREIAAKPRHFMILAAKRLLGLVFGRIYAGIDVDEAGIERMRQAAKKGPLLLLPSHRSHIDYLVLSFVFYECGLPPPHIAAGANLSFFPLGQIFRRSGAFFLRRSFRGDALYAAVFAAYVRRLLKGGFNIEFFIEGGRSRTGKVLPPKFGLLTMVSDAAIDGEVRSAQVVPISIAYEKIVEEGSYRRELAGGEKRKEDMGALLRAGRVLKKSYGRIDLQVGEPFDLSAALESAGAPLGASESERKQAVRRLAHRVSYEISQATALTPSALLASACLATATRGFPRPDLMQRVTWLSARARSQGARFSAVLAHDFDGAVERTVQLFESSGDLELRGAGAEQLVVVPPERRLGLEYYKNNAIHAFGDASIVARAVLSAGEGTREAVRQRALTASRLLKNELVYRPGKSFDAVFAATLAELEAAGWVERAEPMIVTDEGRAALPVLAGLTASYLDAYALVVRVMNANPKLIGKELYGAIVQAGERALVLGELSRPEAISRPLFESAVAFLRDVGAMAESEKRHDVERRLGEVRL